MTETTSSHVVIAGGGVAALETLMALRDLAGDRVTITLMREDPPLPPGLGGLGGGKLPPGLTLPPGFDPSKLKFPGKK